MTKLISCFIFCTLFLFPAALPAQSSYADKTVTFSAGRSTLKAALDKLSSQTGCVFSYDPTKVNDKLEYNFPSLGKQTLKAALHKILPPAIKFKFSGKYVILQRPDAVKADPPVKASALAVRTATPKTEVKMPIITLPVEMKDTLPVLKDTLIASVTDTIPLPLIFSDTIPVAIIATKDTVTTPDSLKTGRSGFILTPGFAANNHLAGFFVQIGADKLYSILSVNTDYNKSYHLGLGVGAKFQFSKHWGMNIDLMQHAMMRGKSYQLKVRAATTELIPALNFAVLPRLQLFAGPALYLIRSRYINGNPTGSLGRYIGYGAQVGLKLELGS